MANITPDDVVPSLRNSLAFNHLPQGLGAGFVNVKNIINGDEYRLRGFEYSLARLLNGRRTAADVVSAARQVGLPVTLSDLDGFVKKLSDHHLVTQTPLPPNDYDMASFEARERWDDKTRQLYRTALREGRAGNLNRALISLECLLYERPKTEAAVHLRKRLKESLKAPDSVAQFRKIFADTERDWRSEEPLVDRSEKERRAVAMGLGGVLALGLLVLSLALVPFPLEVIQPATLVPIASAKVLAPSSGRIATVPVAVGQWVEKGTVLYTYDITSQVQLLEAAVERVDKLNRSLYSNLPQTKAAEDARTRDAKAEARLAQAEAALEQEASRDGLGIAEAEHALSLAQKETSAARQDLDALVPELQRTAFRAQQAELQELETALLRSEVKAPLSGAIMMLAVQPEAEVVKGMGSAQIDDTRKLRAVALVEPRDLPALAPGQSVLLLSQGRATNATLESVSGRQVEVVIDNAAASFQPGPAELQIHAKPVPLIR